MAVSSQIRFLKNGSSGTVTDMLLPIFGGEIITAYEESNHIAGLVNSKTIASGNTMKFPATWKIGSEYHEAGEELLGLDVSTKEYLINLEDRPLVSHFEVDDLDIVLSHFDVRSELSMECGRELARKNDRNVLIGLIKSARFDNSSQTVALATPLKDLLSETYDYTAEFPVGAKCVAAGWSTLTNQAAVSSLLDSLRATAVHFTKLNVPDTDRHCVIPVEMWYALRNTGTLIQGVTQGNPTAYPGMPAYGSANGASGPSILEGVPQTMFLMYMGFKIWMSNHLPNGATYTTGPSKWQGNFADTIGVIFQKDGYAHIQKLGVTTEAFRDVRRQSDFFVAKTFTGGGTLRPCAVVELRKGA